MESLLAAKSILLALLVLFLLQCSSLVGAVDITFYESTTGCQGVAYACYGTDSNTCCSTDELTGGSASIITNSGANCLGVKFYGDGDCNSGTLLDSSSGNTCLTGGGITAAIWYNECHRRRSLLESKTPACTGKVNPNSVVFTEDVTKGKWVITSANAMELYSQLKNVDDVGQLDWIKSRGATFVAVNSDLKLNINQLD